MKRFFVVLISLKNESLPLPFTWGIISTPLRTVSLGEGVRAHARVEEGERSKKRDFSCGNWKRAGEETGGGAREAVFPQVKREMA